MDDKDVVHEIGIDLGLGLRCHMMVYAVAEDVDILGRRDILRFIISPDGYEVEFSAHWGTPAHRSLKQAVSIITGVPFKIGTFEVGNPNDV